MAACRALLIFLMLGIRAEVNASESRLNVLFIAVESPDVNDNYLIDGRTADEALKVMRQIKDKPFFLAVGFVKPHAPYVAPKKYFNLYKVDDFAAPAIGVLPLGAPSQASNDSKELRGYTGIAKRRAYFA